MEMRGYSVPSDMLCRKNKQLNPVPILKYCVFFYSVIWLPIIILYGSFIYIIYITKLSIVLFILANSKDILFF